ncbi:DinB family protein [Candidatus Leptofilum sp.]|uniref:DinB family protein n=1 Tax=Candidatus Leptofilum sp. TaxID=3241576 RepID=UPI003B5CA00E
MNQKARLLAEIEVTQAQFHQLLQSIPDEAFGLLSSNPAWTVGELLYHMSIAPRFMVADVKLILQRPFLLKLLPKLFPERLFHWLNARLTRHGARQLNRQFLADEYDKAHERILQTLHSLDEADLQKHVHYPDWDPLLAGDVSLDYLFGYIKRHFDSHAAEIQSSLTLTLSEEGTS